MCCNPMVTLLTTSNDPNYPKSLPFLPRYIMLAQYHHMSVRLSQTGSVPNGWGPVFPLQINLLLMLMED